MKVRDMSLPRRNVLKVAAAAALLGNLPVAFAQSKKPKIGVIGSGNVGSAIGRSWARAGYDVMFSSRNLDSDKKLAAEVGAACQRRRARKTPRHSVMCCCSRFRMARSPISGRAWAAAVIRQSGAGCLQPVPAAGWRHRQHRPPEGAGVVSAELLPGARIVRALQCDRRGPHGQGLRGTGQGGHAPIAGDDKQAIEIASK